MTDTFERSCAHWSEAGRSEMEHFYALASVDYRHLAQVHDWGEWLAAREAAAGGPLRLLDVACGSGKFPAALQAEAKLGERGLSPVRYDLLDPSAFSLSEAANALTPPFEPGARFETTLQDFDPPEDGYDVVWATHALYALPAAALRQGLERFVRAIAPGGRGFIAHARKTAHYIRFYDAYRARPDTSGVVPYLCAEEIEAVFSEIGADVSAKTITYANQAPDEAEAAVEGYLQRCLFDDTLSLGEMRRDAALGPYLDECRAEDGWRFHQDVALLSVTC